MKTLYLIRHAQSSSPIGIADFDRPLDENGHNDAPKMAKYLQEKGLKIDYFITSPAKRALTTCRYFAEIFGKSNIKKDENLYEALEEDFIRAIVGVDAQHNSVAIFSHNPSISEFGSVLASELFDFPMCGVAVFEINCEQWSEFENAEKTLKHFFIPNVVL